MAALFMVIFSCSNLFAGAWTMEKGNSYHRFAANYYFADKEFDNNGNSRAMASNGEFRDFNLNYYMEYGIIDQLTAIASIYYKDLRKEDDRFIYDTRGTGDFDLGLRYQLYSGTIGIVSVQGLIKTSEFYDKDDALPLGNGQEDYEVRLLYGRSLWSIIPGYINLESGYRWRTDKPSDEFRYLIEVGSDLGSQLYTRAKLDGLISAGNGANQVDNYGNPTATFEYDLTKLDLTIGCKLNKKLGLELGYTSPLYGESTAKGDTWTLALSFQP
ncbi:MAG: hypothetical protein HQK69_03725 [Desulfamplus sp.]|nr:hypothetical protein [Desulfamplus sp.]